jgi:hypothetical protein
MEVDTIPTGARPRRVASDEEIDLADPSTWRINASGDVISTREARAQAEAAQAQIPNGRKRSAFEKLRGVSASRRFKEPDEDVLLEGFHLIPTRVRELNATKRELEEYHDIVRSMQEEVKDDVKSKIANHVAKGRYRNELERMDAEHETMLEIQRKKKRRRKPRRRKEYVPKVLLDTLREDQSAFQWPTRDGQVDPSSSSHPWTIGEEVEAIVEQRWRTVLRAQHDAKIDAILEERAERRDARRNSRSRRRSRRDADSEDGQSSMSVESLSSGSMSYASDEDEEAAIKQAQETVGFKKEDLEEIDLPDQLSAPVLGSISTSLQRALSILGSTARNPHLKPPLHWKVMLNVLHSGQVCEARGSGSNDGGATADHPLRRALDRTKQRLQAIYGEEYDRTRVLRAAAAGGDIGRARSPSASGPRQSAHPRAGTSDTDSVDEEPAEDHEPTMSSVSTFLRKQEEKVEQRRQHLPDWLKGVDEVAGAEIERKEKRKLRAKKRARRLKRQEEEADRRAAEVESRDAEAEEQSV